MKLLVLAVIALAGAVLTWHRRRESRRRLAEIDAGTRCIGCDGTELERLPDGRVRCLGCAHVASLAALGAAKVSEQELRDLTEPADDD
jgi:hypothetical protein